MGGKAMDQRQRRLYLIHELAKENARYSKITIPQDTQEQEILLRSLMNVRMPGKISEEFIEIQNEYLMERAKEKEIVYPKDLVPIKDHIFIWQGDITRLAADAIVNAANSGMTGCYVPNHTCIDNCIHTFGGIQMRFACDAIIKKQGHEEAAGQAKITPAYNLPSNYVIHTVGPIIENNVTEKDERLLASCYRSCLELAVQYSCSSIAFCCISTGVFRFPNQRAAEIAIQTVRDYLSTNPTLDVVFNVYKDVDAEIYHHLLA